LVNSSCGAKRASLDTPRCAETSGAGYTKRMPRRRWDDAQRAQVRKAVIQVMVAGRNIAVLVGSRRA
jgi:hypothetical protein